MRSTKKTTTYTERRQQVDELYLNGWRQVDIAKRLGVTQATISRDLEAIRVAWVESAVRDFDQLKEQELQKVDNLERVYWEQYEASKAPKKSKVSRQVKGARASIEATVKEEERLGNPTYLSGVQWCIQERCKILGIYAAVKNEVAGASGQPLQVQFIDYGLDDTDTD